jgi:hypothetical protein
MPRTYTNWGQRGIRERSKQNRPGFLPWYERTEAVDRNVDPPTVDSPSMQQEEMVQGLVAAEQLMLNLFRMI